MEQVTKRIRSENWTEEDKNLLKELIREVVNIIENKNTDTNTNTRKKAAWDTILNSFNSLTRGGIRTLPQLKSQWSVIKMIKKKEIVQQKIEMYKAGGESLDVSKDDEIYDITSWLPEVTVECTKLDSDSSYLQVPDTGKNTPVIVPPMLKCVDINQLESPQNTHLLDTNLENQTEVHLKRKRSLNKETKQTAGMNIERITYFELKYKKELHEHQLRNENKRSRNLDMEFQILKEKLKFYKRRNQDRETHSDDS